MADDAAAVRRRWSENPFYVLGVRPDATREVVERIAAKLLAELELGKSTAATYATPFGRCERTADLVRGAVAELRDPARRALHAMWAALPADGAHAEPWPEAMAAMGWKGL